MKILPEPEVPLPSFISTLGTTLRRSAMLRMPSSCRFSPEKAETAMGVSCRVSMRRRAVTTTSSSTSCACAAIGSRETAPDAITVDRLVAIRRCLRDMLVPRVRYDFIDVLLSTSCYRHAVRTVRSDGRCCCCRHGYMRLNITQNLASSTTESHAPQYDNLYAAQVRTQAEVRPLASRPSTAFSTRSTRGPSDTIL